MATDQKDKRIQILEKISNEKGPMVALLLSELIQVSTKSSYIRKDDEQRLLFDIKHDFIRKRFRLKTTQYWFYIQNLVDAEYIIKHNLKMNGKLNYQIFIEFNFAKLNELAEE